MRWNKEIDCKGVAVDSKKFMKIISTIKEPFFFVNVDNDIKCIHNKEEFINTGMKTKSILFIFGSNMVYMVGESQVVLYPYGIFSPLLFNEIDKLIIDMKSI